MEESSRKAGNLKWRNERTGRHRCSLPVVIKGRSTSLWPQAVTAARTITITANASGRLVLPHPPLDFKAWGTGV